MQMTETNQQLQVVEEVALVPERPLSPTKLIETATEQANALMGLVEKKKLFATISGRKFLTVEAWVPLARMNNVIPREVSNVRQEDGGYIATVELVQVNTGQVLTRASAECGGPEEKMWANRDPYARRSMAATRATGKACRLAFSWIAVLAGYEPTPAEEMPRDDERPQGQNKPTGSSATGRRTGMPANGGKKKSPPDSYWKFKRGDDEIIGVCCGERLNKLTLEALGFKQGKSQPDTFYAPFEPVLIEELEVRLNDGEREPGSDDDVL